MDAAKTSWKFPRSSSGLLASPRKLQGPASAHIRMKKSPRRFAVLADSSEEPDFTGRRSMVDENMLVLRKRMRELRMEETNYIPPQHWMEWEKKWYPTYSSDVCFSLVWLQNMLLNTRPSVVIAVLALISLSVPSLILFVLIETPIYVKGATM